jgi:hypothetical protein
LLPNEFPYRSLEELGSILAGETIRCKYFSQASLLLPPCP